jgi:hypothetical protein
MRAVRATPRKVAVADLGAWLLKGNADRRDLAVRFEAANPSYVTRTEFAALCDYFSAPTCPR